MDVHTKKNYSKSKEISIPKRNSLVIEKIIGSGGFGSVYKSKYGKETVAVKIIKNKDNGIPYLTELSIMSKTFTSPNSKYINSAIKILLRDNIIYIIQPLALSDLKNYMEHNYISFGNKKQGISQIVSGMMFLHSIGILHLDIKPGNILIYPQINQGRYSETTIWKLSDFGISKTNGGLSQRGVCTNRYRPLEVWNMGVDGLLLTPHIDYWSLGCTIHEIIYDTPIFESQSKCPKENQKQSYTKAIKSFDKLIFNTLLKPEIKNELEEVRTKADKEINYNKPNIKYIKSKKDPIAIILKDMMYYIPEKRNVVGLCDYLNLVYLSPKTLPIESMVKKIKKCYIKAGGKKSHDTDIILEWMCKKIDDPLSTKPDISLYQLLLTERNILSTLNYSII